MAPDWESPENTWVFNHDDLIILVDFMVGEEYPKSDIAEAVRKPWNWAEELIQAKADLTGRDPK